MDDKAFTENRHYNAYYQDELSFLREMGKEFAEEHPTLAHYLSEEGSDPDVERILEGFAFLTGRIRQKLDDELPELTHTMMGLLWPHYLKPIPSMAILEFEPQRALRGVYRVPRINTEVESVPVENTRCRFRTCYDTDLLPLNVENVSMEGQRLRVRFRILSGIEFPALELKRLRLNLHGERVARYNLYLWLRKYVKEITVQSISDGQPVRQLKLGQSNVQPVGFGESDGMLPYSPNSFLGYRLLQEYFAFPDKFMFVDLTGLEQATELGITDEFEVIFHFSRRPRSDEPLRVTRDSIHLNCTPIINLFPRYSDPIRAEHKRTHYRIRPQGPNSQYYEVYSVDRVTGSIQGTAQTRVYEPFYSFQHGLSDRDNLYYHTRLHSSVVDRVSTETYISFITPDNLVVTPPTETITAELTCMNRQLTGQLPLGSIRTLTSSSPEFARFRNITNVTSPVYLPLDGSLQWKLISHLSLNHLSITDKEALRGILALYNFQSLYDRQAALGNERRLDGIRNVRYTRRDRLYRGATIRGNEVQIDMQEDHFAGEGDMYLFACVLDEFLALYADLNSFTRLTVRGVNHGEVYEWPLRIGKQFLL